MGKEPDEIRREIEETRDRMSDTVEAIGYKADVPSRTKEAVARRKDSIVSSVRNAKDTVTSSIAGTGQRVSGTVSERTPSTQDVKQGARRAVGMAQENPLGLAIGSMAVGFVAGLLLPSTRVEDERLGPIADQVKEKALETGQEVLDRGKQVAQETAQTAAGAAQEAVQKTVATAQEKSQEQGQQLTSSAQEKVQEVRSDLP